MINTLLIALVRNVLLVLAISALVLLNAAVWADDGAATASCPAVDRSDSATLASPTAPQYLPEDRARG